MSHQTPHLWTGSGKPRRRWNVNLGKPGNAATGPLCKPKKKNTFISWYEYYVTVLQLLRPISVSCIYFLSTCYTHSEIWRPNSWAVVKIRLLGAQSHWPTLTWNVGTYTQVPTTSHTILRKSSHMPQNASAWLERNHSTCKYFFPRLRFASTCHRQLQIRENTEKYAVHILRFILFVSFVYGPFVYIFLRIHSNPLKYSARIFCITVRHEYSLSGRCQ
jgi:hypothetical protein